jgi:hypothetical protein
MALSTSTVQNLAKALSPEVAKYIYEDERYVEFLMELIPDAIQHCMGDVDPDVSIEISACIMDSIDLSVRS